MPAVFAMRMCRPRSSSTAVDHVALRVTVDPDDVTYTTSRPARSTGVVPAFVSSMNSSEADAPPVSSSDTSRVDGDDDIAASGPAPDTVAPTALAATENTRTSAAAAARRVRSIYDLRAGGRGFGRTAATDRSRYTGERSPTAHLLLSPRLASPGRR
jgi:hypothetical protein